VSGWATRLPRLPRTAQTTTVERRRRHLQPACHQRRARLHTRRIPPHKVLPARQRLRPGQALLRRRQCPGLHELTRAREPEPASLAASRRMTRGGAPLVSAREPDSASSYHSPQIQQSHASLQYPTRSDRLRGVNLPCRCQGSPPWRVAFSVRRNHPLDLCLVCTATLALVLAGTVALGAAAVGQRQCWSPRHTLT